MERLQERMIGSYECHQCWVHPSCSLPTHLCPLPDPCSTFPNTLPTDLPAPKCGGRADSGSVNSLPTGVLAMCYSAHCWKVLYGPSLAANTGGACAIMCLSVVACRVGNRFFQERGHLAPPMLAAQQAAGAILFTGAS